MLCEKDVSGTLILMRFITYLKGNATFPLCEGNKIISHLCNDVGRWKESFGPVISTRWQKPEKAYLKLKPNDEDIELGIVQFAKVTFDIWVANMIGAHGMLKSDKRKALIHYNATQICLNKVARKALYLKASVHMPRIGTDVGGNWAEIEPMILETLCEHNIEVYIYD